MKLGQCWISKVAVGNVIDLPGEVTLAELAAYATLGIMDEIWGDLPPSCYSEDCWIEMSFGGA